MAVAPFKDTGNCIHYARFAQNLNRTQAEVLYWCFFIVVILLLFVSSWYYGICHDGAEKYGAQTEQHRRRMWRCLCVSAWSGAIAVILAVVEVFWLMSLQFCDGEPLMALYWSTWTMLQVGSVIAIVGIILAVTHSMRDRKHPPWALALGTPVLVVAGLLHFIHSAVHRRAKNVRAMSIRSRRRSSTLDPGRGRGQSFSEAPTIRAESESRNQTDPVETEEPDSEDTYNAKIVGYTPEGDIILRIASTAMRRDLYTSSRQPSVSFAPDSVPGRSSEQASTPATAALQDRESRRPSAANTIEKVSTAALSERTLALPPSPMEKAEGD